MKHAYLILAHNDFSILEKNLRLLDDSRNDFYIHIDKKVKDFSFQRYQEMLKYSQIFFIDRTFTQWGGFSLTQCELRLLESAIKGNYQYYHLLSGVDLPLKTNDEIHDFFYQNRGKEFVHFCSDTQAQKVRYRVEQYHFMALQSVQFPIIGPILKKLAGSLTQLLEILHIHRKWDDNLRFAYGAQWFSITHSLASYVVSQKDWIYEHFRFTRISDEHFLQILVENTPFKNCLYRKEKDDNYLSIMRYIDWKRGTPYVFQIKDFSDLMNSPYLFARKFSTTKDTDIVEAIYSNLYHT